MFSTSRKTFPSFIRVELYISIFFFFFFYLKQHFLIHYRAFGSRQDSATEQRPQQSVRTAEDCRSKYVQYVCVRVCSGCVCVFFSSKTTKGLAGRVDTSAAYNQNQASAIHQWRPESHNDWHQQTSGSPPGSTAAAQTWSLVSLTPLIYSPWGEE